MTDAEQVVLGAATASGVAITHKAARLRTGGSHVLMEGMGRGSCQ